jgi:hypothetical protein
MATRYLTLLLGVVTGDPTGTDLGPIGLEATQQVDVLPIDVVDALGVEDRHLLLGASGGLFGLGAAWACH